MNRADKMLSKLGFNKVEEDDFVTVYDRFDDEFNYTHRIEFGHNSRSNRFFVHSYDKDLGDVKNIGNTSVGMNRDEIKAVYAKLKQLDRKSRRR